MINTEPLTDEMMCEIAADAMFDVMTYAMTTGYVSLQDVHLAIGRAVEQAHGIGIKQWKGLTFARRTADVNQLDHLGDNMNANELANELEKDIHWIQDELARKWVVDMLRKQQVEIEYWKEKFNKAMELQNKWVLQRLVQMACRTKETKWANLK